MPDYYPIFLKITGRKCVVVGGGEVAERKASSLLESGALVTVISPHCSEALQRLSGQGSIELLARDYRYGDLKEALVVIAATDDPRVNKKVAREAQEQGTLVNVVDSPEDCSFIAPSVVQRGDLVIAISTGGKSPALARKLREELEEKLAPEYDLLLDIVAKVREELRKSGKRVSSDTWQESITPELFDLVKRGELKKVKDYLASRLRGEKPC